MQPTLEQVKQRNPMFFSITPYGEDQEQTIVFDGDDYLLKIKTGPGTRPVYKIMDDLSLAYVCHE